MLEWVHRLLAGVILGPLLLVIGWLAWRARGHERACRPARLRRCLILLLLVQAGLGGLTVLDQNSPWSVALASEHGAAPVQRAVADLRPHRTSRRRRRRAPPGRSASPSWLLALGAMASAAMTTKSGASLACSTWPLCDGALIPDLADPAIRLNFSHRLLAAGVGVGALALSRGVPAPARARAALAAGCCC